MRRKVRRKKEKSTGQLGEKYGVFLKRKIDFFFPFKILNLDLIFTFAGIFSIYHLKMAIIEDGNSKN
jgi:hypothetical protein